MTPSATATAAATETNTSTSHTTGITTTHPVPTQPFRFLDLPRDIRLMVYDNLLTRRRNTITHNHYGKVMTVTLVTAQPIPPLNKTCKFLQNEAGPFIRAKLDRMSAPWAAPRIIIHASRPFTTILMWSFMVDEILAQIQYAKCQSVYDLAEAAKNGWSPRHGVTEQIINDFAPFAQNAGVWIRTSGVADEDWEIEAVKLYESEHGLRLAEEPKAQTMEEIIARIRAKTQVLIKAARAGLLHISVLFDSPNDDSNDKAYNMSDFLFRLAIELERMEIKTAVHTFGWNPQEIDVDGRGYMRFDGEMSASTWNEEWA